NRGGSAPQGDPAQSRTEAAEEKVSLLSECFQLGTTTSGLPAAEFHTDGRFADRMYFRAAVPMAGSMLEEVSVTGARIMRENIGDYQLYRLPWLTDLNAQQTKQVVFLTKPTVKVERFYSVRAAALDASEIWPPGAPTLMLRWENKEKEGLG